MKNILIGYPLNKYREFDDLLKKLSSFFKITCRDYDYKWLVKNIRKFDIIVPSLNIKIDDKALRHAVNLKLLATPTTGLDHLSFKESSLSIKIISLNDFKTEIDSINSTAELGFALLLTLTRNLYKAAKDTGENKNWKRNNFLGSELSGKTLGIIGMGRIGKKVASFAEAFNMKIIYWDKLTCRGRQRMKELNSLLSVSDYIFISVKLNNETEHLISKSNVKYIKKGACLVNIARGRVVDETALCQALRKGILRGVGADVLEDELGEIKKSPLLCLLDTNPHLNIVVTPHIGGATIEAWQKVFKLIFDYILKNFKK